MLQRLPGLLLVGRGADGSDAEVDSCGVGGQRFRYLRFGGRQLFCCVRPVCMYLCGYQIVVFDQNLMTRY